MVTAEGAITEGELTMPAKTVVTDCAMLEVANADGIQYKVVYSSLIDDDTSCNGIEGSAVEAVNSSLSYQYTCISGLRVKLAESMGALKYCMKNLLILLIVPRFSGWRWNSACGTPDPVGKLPARHRRTPDPPPLFSPSTKPED